MTITGAHASPFTARLRAGGFVGPLVEPADADYDSARAGWNGASGSHPLLLDRLEQRRPHDLHTSVARPSIVVRSVMWFADGVVCATWSA